MIRWSEKEWKRLNKGFLLPEFWSGLGMWFTESVSSTGQLWLYAVMPIHPAIRYHEKPSFFSTFFVVFLFHIGAISYKFSNQSKRTYLSIYETTENSSVIRVMDDGNLVIAKISVGNSLSTGGGSQIVVFRNGLCVVFQTKRRTSQCQMDDFYIIEFTPQFGWVWFISPLVEVARFFNTFGLALFDASLCVWPPKRRAANREQRVWEKASEHHSTTRPGELTVCNWKWPSRNSGYFPMKHGWIFPVSKM